MKSSDRILTALTVAIVAVSGSANAATKPAKMELFDVAQANPNDNTLSKDFTVKPDSYYNLTMGRLGWTHHSAWGYMMLKKGKPVTIKVEATSEDAAKKAAFHPGISIWSVPQKKNRYVDITYNETHFYNQWKDVAVVNPQDESVDGKPILKGTLKWDFITNGFDRDGMEGIKVLESGQTEKTDLGILPADFDQPLVNRIWDGTPNVVEVTFVPPVKGYYKFAVGGINPGAALWWTNPDTNVYEVHRTDEPVKVTVTFPE
jgi:hypothetical protein